MLTHSKNTWESEDPIKHTHVRLGHLRGKASFPMHWHLELEIMLPIQGRSQIICADQRYTLEQDDLFIVCPGFQHSILPGDGLRRYFILDCSMIHQIHIVEMAITLMSPGLHLSPKFSPTLYHEVQRGVMEIIHLTQKDTLTHEALIYSNLLEILNLVFLQLGGGEKQDRYTEKTWTSNHDTMLEACRYINQNFKKELTLKDVASKIGFSKYHFARLFRDFTNVTFYNYLTQKRITYATQLLAVHDMTISDIAYQSGFNSPTSFARTFKQFTRSTPSEFRKTYNPTNKINLSNY